MIWASGEIAAWKQEGRIPALDAHNLRYLRQHCILKQHHSVKDITAWAQEYFRKPSKFCTSINHVHFILMISPYWTIVGWNKGKGEGMSGSSEREDVEMNVGALTVRLWLVKELLADMLERRKASVLCVNPSRREARPGVLEVESNHCIMA